jgi:hypothetical protein
MKKNLFLIALIATLISSCSPGKYASRKDYEDGEWSGHKSGKEIQKEDARKLAFKKMKEGGEGIDKIKGYRGVIKNFDNRSNVNIVLQGPENPSFFLAPGQKLTVYLIPGDYSANFYRNNKRIKIWNFSVTAEESNFMGEKVFFYLYHGNNRSHE